MDFLKDVVADVPDLPEDVDAQKPKRQRSVLPLHTLATAPSCIAEA